MSRDIGPFHVHTIRERRSLRVFADDHDARRGASVEFALFADHCSIGARLGHDDKPLTFNLCVPYLLSTWVSFDAKPLRDLATWMGNRFPGDPSGKWATRRLELSIHNWALWWDLWTDDGGWTSKQPKWRDGCWHPLGHHQRQSEEVIETRDVVITMPERGYRGAAVRTRTTWGFERLPRAFDRVMSHVEITMHEGEQVPFPGKGENSWDCGEDATFSSSMLARSIEEAIGRFVGSTLERRRRHGGKNWVPEAKVTRAEAQA